MPTLIAELATNHGGDVDLAREMIDYAVAGGATHIKTQAYYEDSINRRDPQVDWLRKARLTGMQHRVLKAHCLDHGVEYFASVFDSQSLRDMLDYPVELTRIKIPSTEALSGWWYMALEPNVDVLVSLPWGVNPGKLPAEAFAHTYTLTRMSAVPLYPTPIDALWRVDNIGTMGWSDHCVGLSGCQYAIAHGSDVVEVHVSIPGKGRNCPWDKTKEDLKRLRDWLEDCQTIRSGVSRTFRERWVR